MKQKILENKFVCLFYTPEFKEIEYIYFDTTLKMSDEEYYTQLLDSTEAMEKFSVEYIIIDFREFKIPLVPEIQELVVQNVVPRWINMGLKKVAIVMPSDFIINLSIEQQVQEANPVIAYAIAYVDSFENARLWFYHS